MNRISLRLSVCAVRFLLIAVEVLFYGTMERLLDLLLRRDSTVPLDRAALELATIEFPELDIDGFLGVLDSYAAELGARVAGLDGRGYIRAANHYLFEELGFRGNAADYYNPRNSCLNEVLTARTGIPITLSVVYIEIARRLDRCVAGIGLPGHFVVRYDDGLYSVFVDPFHGGNLLAPEQCYTLARDVAGIETDPDPHWLEPVTKRDILTRMLRNLAVAYASQSLNDKGVAALNLLIRANPDSAEEYRQRGVLQMRAGRLTAAKDDLTRYLELARSAPDRDQVREQIQSIQHWLASLN